MRHAHPLDTDVRDRRLRARRPDARRRCSPRAGTAWPSTSASRSCTTCRAPSTSTTRSCRSGRRSASPDELDGRSSPVDAYEWFGADGEPILRSSIRRSARRAGSPATSSTSRRSSARSTGRCARCPPPSVHRGWSAEALEQAGDHVEVTLRRVREPSAARRAHRRDATVRARYVIGADGANSFVREAAGIGFDDQGSRSAGSSSTSGRDDIEALSSISRAVPVVRPGAAAHAHAQRPAPPPLRVHAAARRAAGGLRGRGARLGAARALVHAGRRRARPPRGLRVPRAAWREHDARRPRRCSPATPRTPCRRSWARACAPGVRDAANLAWRLDLVLRGVAGDELLDTYTPSASRRTSGSSTSRPRWGGCSCSSTRQAAAERDAALRAADAAAAARRSPPLAGRHARPGRPLAGARARPGRSSASAGARAASTTSSATDFVLLARRRPREPSSPTAPSSLERIGAERRRRSTSSRTSTAA